MNSKILSVAFILATLAAVCLIANQSENNNLRKINFNGSPEEQAFGELVHNEFRVQHVFQVAYYTVSVGKDEMTKDDLYNAFSTEFSPEDLDAVWNFCSSHGGCGVHSELWPRMYHHLLEQLDQSAVMTHEEILTQKLMRLVATKKNLLQLVKYVKFDQYDPTLPADADSTAPYAPTGPEYDPSYPADANSTAPTNATGTEDGDMDYVAYVLVDNLFSTEDVFTLVSVNFWKAVAGAPVPAWNHDSFKRFVRNVDLVTGNGGDPQFDENFENGWSSLQQAGVTELDSFTALLPGAYQEALAQLGQVDEAAYDDVNECDHDDEEEEEEEN